MSQPLQLVTHNNPLHALEEFSVKRQLEWGAAKCKVMEVGSHKESDEERSLGEKIITKCDTYRYLGEEISRNGKNKANLEERFKKVHCHGHNDMRSQ